MPRRNDRKQSSRRRIFFKLRAPFAQKVQLAGSFNSWDPASRVLRRDPKGTWKTSMLLEPGAYEFRFLVDGEWHNDPEAEQIPNSFGSTNNLLNVM